MAQKIKVKWEMQRGGLGLATGDGGVAGWQEEGQGRGGPLTPPPPSLLTHQDGALIITRPRGAEAMPSRAHPHLLGLLGPL